jgi:hypothetical protein
MIGAHTDPSLVGANVIDTIRIGASQFRIDEVMHLDFDRLTGLLPFPPRILADADQFLLLGIDRDNRLARFERSPNTGIDLDKLRITIRMVAPFKRLGVGLQAVALRFEQLSHGNVTDLMPLASQFVGQFPQTLAGPAQRRLRVTACHRINQQFEVGQQGGIRLRKLLPAPTQTAHSSLR